MGRLRHALRLLGRSPVFAIVAIMTLAIGIGANTAIFSVADALLFRPLPFRDPARLVMLSQSARQARRQQGPLSWLRWQTLQHSSHSFAEMAAFTNEVFNLTGRGDPEQIVSARVSWNFFDVLGVRPLRGRTFRPEEDTPGGAAVALVTHAFWTRHFGAVEFSPGRTMTLDGRDYTIAGILPPQFRFEALGLAAIWAPRVFERNIITPAQITGGSAFLNVVARLRPDLSISQAQAEMDTLATQYRHDQPQAADADPSLVVYAGRLQDELSASLRPALEILAAAVTLLLLIACANVAGLLLSRALARRQEMAVRAATGASRRALIGQMLVESVVLALLGGGAGVLLSSWGTDALAALAESQLPGMPKIAIDARVLAFTFILSAVCGVLFGLVPALEISRADLNLALRAESRGATAGRRPAYLRNVLVICQVMISVVLLIGAGLLLRSFVQLRTASPGFDSRHVLTMNIALPPARYGKGPQMTAFYYRLVEQVRAIPGVQSAGVSSALPANPIRFSPALVEGQPQAPLGQRPIFTIQMFSPGYVETMRIPLVRGRDFTVRDDARAPRVVLVNEALVRRYWPGADPVGKHILLGRLTQPAEVVGVIGDIHNGSLAADPQPEIDVPFAQLPWASMNLLVRTPGDPHAFVSAVRAQVLSADRDQPVTAVRTMEEVLDAAAGEEKMLSWLLGGFAACALLLCAVGIYATISYAVAARTAEMGIRVALGASEADILRLVVGKGLILAGAGVALGVAAALAAVRVLASQLYHVSLRDPVIFAASALVFVSVAAAASYIPARRAMKVDPIIALR
jgi:putative ABC transport system permease protein